ncbi:hypothetical protein [Bosea sp. RAC05]|uniref:hypothetical protein n=1 Tax=Bosea sp. RAC05 TaxID=1842539 RepID=UPI000858AB98|nr:hypothetical protein [Bosea sp. RAC05]AOG02964.1 hypothetical protein BSY19_4921 [Bosea sp. RAC05]
MKVRTLSGIILGLAGVGMFAAGGAVLSQALDRDRANEDLSRRAELACRTELVKFARVTPAGNIYELDFGEVRDDPRQALADATTALAACPTRTIIDMCLGAACNPTGGQGPVRLTMRLGSIRK